MNPNTNYGTNQNSPYYLAPEEPSKAQAIVKKSSKIIFNILQAIVGLSIIGIIMYFFITPVNVVDGPSMQPNFCNKDIYLTFKLGVLINPMGYKRGQVIAFKENATTNLIKRVIGIPGDIIKIVDGRVYRNGELLNETYLPEGRATSPYNKVLYDGIDYKVPEGNYIVFGDNRGNSIDSRDIGPIDPANANVTNGNVFAIIWPPQRIRLFDQNSGYQENNCDGTITK